MNWTLDRIVRIWTSFALTVIATLMVLAYIQVFVKHRVVNVSVDGAVEVDGAVSATVDQGNDSFKVEVEEPVNVEIQR
jgi:TRAP-type C4-dicarboxylate transport system permease small subunit